MSSKRRAKDTVREAASGYGVTEVAASDLKNAWHRWLERVSEGGQTVIVTRYGKPIATLAPIPERPEEERLFGALEGWVVRADDLVSPAGEEWEAEG